MTDKDRLFDGFVKLYLKKKHRFLKIREILSLCILREIPIETAVYREGEAPFFLYFILRGSVRLTKTTLKGRIRTLGIIREGEHFGAPELFLAEHSVTAVSLSPCTVACLPKDLFHQKITEYPDFLYDITATLSSLLRMYQNTLATEDAETGIVAWLKYLTLKKYDSIPEPPYPVLRSRTHEEIAGIIGTERETVSRIFSRLRKTGVIKMEAEKIIIRDTSIFDEITYETLSGFYGTDK